VENFGTWRDREGRLVWGVNDFDEAFALPYTNDLVRLALSAHLAISANHLALRPADACEAIVKGYAKGLKDGGKPFVLAEFLARVRALIRRGFHTGNAQLRYADLELDRHRRSAKRGKDIIPLTSKEFALLELFLLHADDLVTRSEILLHVWDSQFDGGSNLVDVYINRLRQKVDQNGFAKLIHTVRGLGYRLGMPEQ